jgi:regulator of replication initiation timing
MRNSRHTRDESQIKLFDDVFDELQEMTFTLSFTYNELMHLQGTLNYRIMENWRYLHEGNNKLTRQERNESIDYNVELIDLRDKIMHAQEQQIEESENNERTPV